MRLNLSRASVLATLLVPAALLAAPAAAVSQETTRTLDLEMYLDMESVSNPQLSPDGSQIVYTRGWVDRMNDSRESSIWIMNADGSRNRFLVDGSGPVWSPDGTRIAYTARGEPSGSQIFVRWMDAEGATTQITRVENGPGSIRWSPDGEWISFSMNVDSNEGWRVNPPGRPDGARWTAEPKVVTRADYRSDRQGYTDTGWRHLFVVPAEGGTARQLTDGDWDHSGGEWTADGGRLVFSANRSETAELDWRQSDIYAVDVRSGQITQLTSRPGIDTSPLPSPRGGLIAYVARDETDDTYRNGSMWVMNEDGSNPRKISGDFDRQTTGGAMWAPDGSGVYFSVNSEGTRNVYFVDLDDGVRQLTQGNHLMVASSMSANGRMIAGVLSTPYSPGDVVVMDPRRPDQVTQLTRVNEDVLGNVQLGEHNEIWYESVDDYRIQGWYITPPDFDPSKKYPLMLSIHGGPHSMYTVGFNFGWQEHAANGYVVLYTNPRGSTGYGSAFGNAIKNAYPGKDFDDLMNGVDELIDMGFIDEQNMFVYGCSGGGVLTSWTVGHTDRFAAASANCPVTNWFSFVGTTDGIGWYRNFEHFPWEDPSEHLRRSPLMYVGNVTTPTMLMTGELDLRTPMPQTEEYYAALKVLGVPTAMIRFQDEWHGTSSNPSNFLRTQLYLREWFERHSRSAGVTQQ
jgi:dipeptidyl aminopeptidase/acylaminoacyl peptidase